MDDDGKIDAVPEQEGVIKYQLDFASGAAPDEAWVDIIRHWRWLLFSLKLIGQQPHLYQGYGYGNISCRIPEQPQHFIVSATQTGGEADLSADGYCTVLHCDPAQNYLQAKGVLKPSSEAMTHGAIYQAASDVNVVMHVHSARIWSAASALGFPATAIDTAYGTPALAAEIKQMFAEGCFTRQKLLVIPGHEDGVISFGDNAEQAGRAIVEALAKSLGLS